MGRLTPEGLSCRTGILSTLEGRSRVSGWDSGENPPLLRDLPSNNVLHGLRHQGLLPLGGVNQDPANIRGVEWLTSMGLKILGDQLHKYLSRYMKAGNKNLNFLQYQHQKTSESRLRGEEPFLMGTMGRTQCKVRAQCARKRTCFPCSLIPLVHTVHSALSLLPQRSCLGLSTQ